MFQEKVDKADSTNQQRTNRDAKSCVSTKPAKPCVLAESKRYEFYAFILIETRLYIPLSLSWSLSLSK